MEAKEVTFHVVNMDDITAQVISRVRRHEEDLLTHMLELRELLVLRSAFPHREEIASRIQYTQQEILMLHIRIQQCAPQHEMEGVPLAFNAREATIGWPDMTPATPAENEANGEVRDDDDDPDEDHEDDDAGEDVSEVTAIVQPDTTPQDEPEMDTEAEVADVVPIAKPAGRKPKKALARAGRTQRS